MKEISLTGAGRQHAQDYLKSAMEKIEWEVERDNTSHELPEITRSKLQRSILDLRRVQVLLAIEFGPAVPINAVSVLDIGPQDLPF